MKKNNIFILLGIITIILIWLISSVLIDNSLVLPTITEVLYSLKDILGKGATYLIILSTFLKLLLIIVISLVIALGLGILSYISSKFESFIKPIFVLLKTIPVIAIIILLLIFFGNSKSPYIMTLLVVLPIMYEGMLTSLKSINPDILDDVKTISGFNFSIIKNIYFPLIFSNVMMSITQSFGLGLKVMIMGEFITQPNNTIGYMMQLERSNLNTSSILAWTIILVIIVLVIELLIAKATKLYKFF